MDKILYKRTITLAQQLDIKLFAISTLATIAWSYKQESQNLSVQMRGQKGQLFTAIYQLGEMSLNPVLVDTLMNPVAWKEMLANLKNSYHLIQVENSLGKSVVSLLELAHLEWRKGNRPHWSEALPFYGQNPV